MEVEIKEDLWFLIGRLERKEYEVSKVLFFFVINEKFYN